MRVSREQAAQNKARVIDAAARLFRERGFQGVGVADIMKAADLTHGGFYGQFESKDDLANQACAAANAVSAEKWRAVMNGSPDRALEALVDHYLSRKHRDNPATGCAFAALAADAAREDGELRLTFTEGLASLLEVLTAVMPGRSKAQRQRAAMAKMSELVGAVILARATGGQMSDDILAAVRQDILAATPRERC